MFDFDAQNVCRICLKSVTESTDISSKTEETRAVLLKISECFQITLDSEKFLPCVICSKCIEELNNANNFRLKCISMNERFEECYQKYLKTAVVPPEDSLNSHFSTTEELDNNHQTSYDTNSELNEEYLTSAPNRNCLECDKCFKVLKTTKSLLHHMVSMHEKRNHAGRVSGFGSNRLYHCHTCSYSTPHSQTLVNHMRRHNGERPYLCKCGKSFTQASSLSAHRKTHSSETFFTCSECGKQFKHAYSLKTHLLVHSEGNYTCNICSKILKSQQNLKIHMKRHNNEYDYSCEDCGDTFVTSAELTNHRSKHTVEKNIVCHICDYTTNTRKNLVVHLKRHAGNRTEVCYFCEKAFYTCGDLRRHMRVHTREKAFSCETCGQRFTYSTSLNKHMLTAHGVQYKWSDTKIKERIQKT